MFTRPFAEIRSQIGAELGVSRWILVDQNRINAFADATDDHNAVHVDVGAANLQPGGTTIAHGLLTLSLITAMAGEVIPVPAEMVRGYYYGFDRVRFVHPLKCGSRVRGRFKLLDYVERRPGEWLRTIAAKVEIEGDETPALVTEFSAVHFIVS